MSDRLKTIFLNAAIGGMGLLSLCSCVNKHHKETVVSEQLMNQMVSYIIADSAVWHGPLQFMDHLLDLDQEEIDINEVFSFNDSTTIYRGRGSLIFFCMLIAPAVLSDDLNEGNMIRYYSSDHQDEIQEYLEMSFNDYCENFTRSSFPIKAHLLELEDISRNKKPKNFHSSSQNRPRFFAYGIEESNIICVSILPVPVNEEDKEKYGPFYGSGSYLASFILDETREKIIFFGSSYQVM